MELRFNPLLRTYTMVATNRQHRPNLEANYCAFCPGPGKKVPEHFDVLSYPNDFPVLSQQPETVAATGFESFINQPAYGRCEVILYSPDHHKQLYDLSDEHVLKLVHLWRNRFAELRADPNIQYIFEFENRGEEVGVTMHHPHGQLYAYSWIPTKIKMELDNCKHYFQETGRNLFADLNRDEQAYGKRVVAENDSFIAYIPYFTDYPFGVFVVSKALKPDITCFTEEENRDLAMILKQLVRGFDRIYDRPFPYMMCIHQQPVNHADYADSAAYYAFHIEFYPPLRAKDKIKWYSGSEMGAGAAANPLDVDVCAAQLRACIQQA
ncbi:MAG: galactose-1-phosphate uridylyltransferase [Chitinophagales bacterium]